MNVTNFLPVHWSQKGTPVCRSLPTFIFANLLLSSWSSITTECHAATSPVQRSVPVLSREEVWSAIREAGCKETRNDTIWLRYEKPALISSAGTVRRGHTYSVDQYAFLYSQSVLGEGTFLLPVVEEESLNHPTVRCIRTFVVTESLQRMSTRRRNAAMPPLA